MPKVVMGECYLKGEFGVKLWELRKLKRMTQAKLAEKVELSENEIKRLEMGGRPGLESLRRLNEFFGGDILHDIVFPRIGLNEFEREFHSMGSAQQELVMKAIKEIQRIAAAMTEAAAGQQQ